MAARRGKSQARRNQSNGLPGWAWLVIGVLVTLLVVPAIYQLIARRAGMTGARDRLVDEVLATAAPASPSPAQEETAPEGRDQPAA